MFAKFLDKYYKYPIVIDFIVTVIIWIVATKIHVIPFRLTEEDKLIDLLSSLIGTMISLSGFILAALTIIVTFKSSLRARGIEDSTNALELLFSSHHYKAIVKVFKDAIIEFILVAIAGYVLWQCHANLETETLNLYIALVIFLISTTTLRSLFMLFKILNLEHYRRD